jgi:Domain of unknown function (DUF1707)
MSWLDQLSLELQRRGVGRRERARIRLEFEDHIACDPGSEERLGDPHGLAGCFADELASARARRSAFVAFVALAVTATALAVSQLAIGRAGGYPGLAHGVSLALFVPAAQVALVAGMLALARAVRRRRAALLPAAEIELIERRARIAVLAGLTTVAGLGLWLVDLAARLPAWYLAAVGSSSVVAGLALFAALRELSSAARIVSSVAGPAGDVYDDLPSLGCGWLRRREWRLGVLGSLTAAALTALLLRHAEHSVAEGVQRGIAEGIAARAGYVTLGRALGLFTGDRAARQRPSFGSIAVGDSQLAGDDDRAAAERVLRESFAAGRLTIEELTARVSAVHNVRTVAQLHETLNDLPHRR